ncbi:MAG: putative sulfate exporter family transporter [Anaerolineales bacterium]
MTTDKPNLPSPKLSFWERNLFGMTISELPGLLPGLVVVVALAWSSIGLSKYLGVNLLGFEKSPISPVMLALLLGLIIGAIVSIPTTFTPGIRFSVKKILRFGIILLGIRLTIFDVFKLGAMGVPIVMICILGALFITTTISKRLQLPERLGTLIAVGTSICGVSAILATGPAIDADEKESAYAVAVITVFGLLATLFYPYIVNAVFAGDAVRAGLFLGTSVHDTSQVVGSASVYADVFGQSLALDVATVTKLVRNVFMALVIPFMAFYYGRRTSAQASGESKKTNILKLFPLFILGFLTFAALRSIGDASINLGNSAFGLWTENSWTSLISTVKTWAGNFLVVALAGVGLSTNFQSFKGLGFKPFFVGLISALAVGGVSFIAITLLGSYVSF